MVKYTSFYKVKTKDKKEDEVLFVSYLTNSPSRTKKIGESFAKNILKCNLTKRAVILGLIGDLGGGKTTFLQGVARGLGIKQAITSPTFVIMRKLKIPRSRKSSLRDGRNHKFKNFYHFDCYRIQKPTEMLTLGFKEIISDPQNIVVLEWADKIRKMLHEDSLILEFEFIDKNTRKIIIRNTGHEK